MEESDEEKQKSINRILISPEEKLEILEYAIRVGHKKDIEEAKEEEKLKIAKKLLKQNISLDIILSATGLTKEEIENLK